VRLDARRVGYDDARTDAFYDDLLRRVRSWKADGIDAPQSSARTATALRPSLVEKSPIELEGLGRRTALAATELLIGSLIAAIVSVGLGQGVWVRAAMILAYSRRAG
jgi:hypothetical protein